MEKLRVVEKIILDTFLFNILRLDLVRDLFRSTIKKLIMLNQTKKNKLIILFIFRSDSRFKYLGFPSALSFLSKGCTLSNALPIIENERSKTFSTLEKLRN